MEAAEKLAPGREGRFRYMDPGSSRSPEKTIRSSSSSDAGFPFLFHFPSDFRQRRVLAVQRQTSLQCMHQLRRISSVDPFNETYVNFIGPRAELLLSMKKDKTPWYQLKDSQSKWYHHLMHCRVLIMLVLMAIVFLLAIGVGIFALFGQ